MLSRAGHNLLNLVYIAFADGVCHQWCVEHNLNGGAAALAIYSGHQLLRHNTPQIEGQVHPQLAVTIGGKKVINAVQCLVGIISMQSRQHQMTRFGKGNSMLHGFTSTNFTNQNNVRGLTQGVL